jgi:hypothetical protein
MSVKLDLVKGKYFLVGPEERLIVLLDPKHYDTHALARASETFQSLLGDRVLVVLADHISFTKVKMT